MNFSSGARINSFQFNNSVINELCPQGKQKVQTEIRRILQNPDFLIEDLSVGVELTDDTSSHFYDNYTTLCRYSVYSHTTASTSLVFAYKGDIVSRIGLNMEDLDIRFKDLFEAYVKRLGIILMDRDSSEWRQKGKPATLESFVQSISVNPLDE